MIEQPKLDSTLTPQTKNNEPSLQEVVNNYSDALHAAQEIPVHLKTDICYEIDGTYSPNVSSVDVKRRTLNLLETSYGNTLRALDAAMTEYQKCAAKEGFNHLDYHVAAPGNISVVNLTHTTSYLVTLLNNLATIEQPGREILLATLAVFELWQLQCNAVIESNSVAAQEAQDAHDASIYSQGPDEGDIDEEVEDDGAYSWPLEEDERDRDPVEEMEEDVANWRGASFPTWT